MSRLTIVQVRQIRELRYERRLTLGEVARIVGTSMATVRRYAPGRPKHVENEDLRHAFIASGLTPAEVAHRLDWYLARKGYTFADGHRVSQALGLNRDHFYHKGEIHYSYRRLIDAETAALIAHAIGVAPNEIGL